MTASASSVHFNVAGAVRSMWFTLRSGFLQECRNWAISVLNYDFETTFD